MSESIYLSQLSCEKLRPAAKVMRTIIQRLCTSNSEPQAVTTAVARTAERTNKKHRQPQAE